MTTDLRQLAEAKERPILFKSAMVRALLAGTKTQTRRAVKRAALEWLAPGMFNPEYVASAENGLCPYGHPGDRLWVRESWAYNPDLPGVASRACFMADPEHKYDGIKWKPSIHMPRAACRLVLEVTDVRVQRLQDISEDDAAAEGWPEPPPDGTPHPTPRTWYSGLWDSINGAGSWDANPWVWAVSFRRAAFSSLHGKGEPL